MAASIMDRQLVSLAIRGLGGQGPPSLNPEPLNLLPGSFKPKRLWFKG